MGNLMLHKLIVESYPDEKGQVFKDFYVEISILCQDKNIAYAIATLVENLEHGIRG